MQGSRRSSPRRCGLAAKYVIPSGRFRVNVNFMARAGASCGGCFTTVYVGNKPPNSLDGFQSDYTGLDKQWDAHTYAINLAGQGGKGDDIGLQTAVIAIGFANLEEKGLDVNAMGQAIHIDNLGIEFEPIK